MATSNTTERVKEFIRCFYSDYNWMEGMTGIKASKWRDLDREKTKAVTAEMIDELCRAWPEFAYWFVTGRSGSERGQTTPGKYLELNYETVRFLEPGPAVFWRDESGQLCGTQGSMNLDKRSDAYELSVACRVLEGSGSTNWDDAQTLAPRFREAFMKDLTPGRQTSLTGREIKLWVNQFPISERSNDGSRQN
ncbi:MAG: hypothetical protein K0R43_657 [Pseudoduganella sp.]|nr:hypothetical protein [Pseudoduganella sp.]